MTIPDERKPWPGSREATPSTESAVLLLLTQFSVMATPPASLVAVAEAVARLHDSNDHSVEALKKIGTSCAPGIKSLWGRLVRGRPAVTLQRAVTLAQLAHLHSRNVSRSRSSPLIWVDDRPANNAKEAQQLKSLGLDVKQVTTTAEALSVATEGA